MEPAAVVYSEILSLLRLGRAFHPVMRTILNIGEQAVMMPKSASREAKSAIMEYASMVAGLP